MPEGLDHEVSSSGDATVIRRRRPDAGGLDVSREAALLRIVRRSVPLPVPRILRTWPELGAMEMERVPGRPLLEVLPLTTGEQARRLGSRLGELIAALAAIPVAELEEVLPLDLPRPGQLLAEAATEWEEVRHCVPRPSRDRVAAFLDSAPELGTTPAPLPTHQDLGAEHVFVGPDLEITGIIDWSDSAIGDPAVDLGLVLRDLGPAAGESAVARLAASGLPAEGLLPRAHFHARVRALEDLGYGVSEDLPLYRDNALRAIARLFPD